MSHEKSYTQPVRADEPYGPIYSCNDCGAHGSSIDNVKHYSTCAPTPPAHVEPEGPRPRPLHVIARDIKRHWNPVNYAAVPYLTAMAQLDSITDDYGADNAQSVVMYFLCNAKSFRGEDARRLKKELKTLIA